MLYRPRHVEARVRRHAERFPVLVVTGARQVGKSTLLHHLVGARARTIEFDPVQDVANARQDPELFLRLNPPPLVLDEVQHAPEVLAALKRVVDERRGESGLYFLTGSQQLTVLRGIQESLAGRAVLVDLWPMSARELAGQTDDGLLAALLDTPDARDLVARLGGLRSERNASGTLLARLFRGGYPGLMDMADEDVPDWFASYLRTYVERDARVLRDFGEPHEFSRFVRLAAALTAQELNASQLGREIGITPRTARAWLDVLVQSYQALVLDPWSGNSVKRVSGRPKLHVTDSGLAAHLLAVSSPVALGSHPALGALFESWVVMELVKQSQALSARPRLWHWRSAGGAEVDLLLERDGVLSPVEVKLTARPSRHDARGLAAFAAAHPGRRLGPRVVVHAGPDLELLNEETVAVPFWAM